MYKLTYFLGGAPKTVENKSTVPLREIAKTLKEGEEWYIRNAGGVLLASSKDK